MMGENQVGAAAMHIHLLAQMLERHRRTLDVPARSPLAPGTLPARLVRRARLPEDEIERVLLARVIRISAALGRQLDHLLATEPAKAAIVGDTAHAEIDVALSPVGVALRLELAHQLDDLRNR